MLGNSYRRERERLKAARAKGESTEPPPSIVMISRAELSALRERNAELERQSACASRDQGCPCQEGDLCNYRDDPVSGTTGFITLRARLESSEAENVLLRSVAEAAWIYRNMEPKDSMCDLHADSSCGTCPGCEFVAALSRWKESRDG